MFQRKKKTLYWSTGLNSKYDCDGKPEDKNKEKIINGYSLDIYVFLISKMQK